MVVFASRRIALCLLLAVALATVAGCGGRDAAKRELRAGTAPALLAEAQRQMEIGAYSQAVEIYNALEIRHPFSEENREGQLGLMFAYYKDRQPESSLEAADKFIRENPRHPRVDYAYYMRGLAYHPRGLGPVERLFRVDRYGRPQDDARRAFDNFAVFLNRFPDSEWAPDARQRMVFLRNAVAEYEVNVAQYYMTRRAYIAAANRAKRVVEEFQGTTAVNDALEVMIASYEKLELNELARDAEKVLAENRQKRVQ